MILQIFAVYDQKSHAFASPFYLAHVDLAKRAFAEAANTPGHSLAKYPEDFFLYRLGTWNDETSEFSPLPQKEYVAHALEYRAGTKLSVVEDKRESA